MLRKKSCTRNRISVSLFYIMNSECQEMGTYQIFVVPMGNAKITEELDFHPRAPVLR